MSDYLAEAPYKVCAAVALGRWDPKGLGWGGHTGAWRRNVAVKLVTLCRMAVLAAWRACVNARENDINICEYDGCVVIWGCFQIG